MSIKSTLGGGGKTTPAISLPFIWRSPDTGAIYLRFRPHIMSGDSDLCLNSVTSHVKAGDTLKAFHNDEIAWSARYDGTVTLENK